MKPLSKLLAGIGLVTILSLLLSTSAWAGGSYGFSFGYNSGGCGPRYYGGCNYSYPYYAPPAYFYRPAPVYYYVPPPIYYAPPVVTYQPCSPPTYIYSGGSFYSR
jgi:hypothetical protein